MEKTQKGLCAYVRVSTAGQAESGLGIAAQKKAIRLAALADGFTIGSWHADEGRSGKSMRGRPGLAAALAEVAAGRAGGLVVSKLDRLGRSSADVLALAEQAQRAGWRLLALDCGLDSSTPAGELVLTALSMAARFEYRRISERQLEKHETLRRLGRARGRPAAPRDVADRIIEQRAAGGTWQAIADTLNAVGTPTVRGGAEWRPSAVRSAALARQRELLAQAS